MSTCFLASFAVIISHGNKPVQVNDFLDSVSNSIILTKILPIASILNVRNKS